MGRSLRLIFRTAMAALWLTIVATPVPADNGFRLPLDDYPVDDDCSYAWGDFNVFMPRCNQPGRHVADDACVPLGTDVFAVADGRVCFSQQVGDCPYNWGWITVVEHVYKGAPVCVIYGHSKPQPGIAPRKTVTKGQHIADVEWPCGSHHIHFAVHPGGYGVADGAYAPWLLGYLPDDATCPEYPLRFPGGFVDPVEFVLGTQTPVATNTWGSVKTTYSNAE